MELNKNIIKDFENTPIDKLSSAPIYALYGISDRAALALYKALRIETIEDMAHLKYSEWAREICRLADRGTKNLDPKKSAEMLVKKYRNLTINELADSPLFIFYGLSKKGAKLLNKSLNIHTVRDLSNLKYISLARTIDYKNRLIKDYEKAPLISLINAPIYALQGVSKKDAKLLQKAFNVTTIADLANLKYAHWAQELEHLAETESETIDMGPYKDKLIKRFEQKTPKQLMKAPLHALQGISKKDSELLDKAFKTKTVKKLANLKYIHWSQNILELCKAASALKKPLPEKNKKLFPKITFLIILLLFCTIIGIFFYKEILNFLGFDRTDREPEKNSINTELIIIEKEQQIPEEDEGNNFYKVKNKDTLVTISEAEFGTYTRWSDIYNLNKDKIKDPRFIYPGQRLKIPEK